MFDKGDILVHPIHGACVVQEIKDITIDKETKPYYVLVSDITSMKLMVSIEKAEKNGIRKAISKKEAKSIVEDFESVEPTWINDARLRKVKLMQDYKSRNLVDLIAMIKSLMVKDTQSALTSADKQMLIDSQRLLFSELACVSEKSFDEIEDDFKNIVEKEYAQI